MLNYIYLENFRSFGAPTTVPLAPITLFFGENSAGKTSILHALSLLKQTQDANDERALVVRDPRGLVDLGSFEELIFDHDLDRALRIGIGWQNPTDEGTRRTAAGSKRPLHKRARDYLGEPGGSMGKEWGFRFKRKVGIEWDSVAFTDGKSPDPLVRLRPCMEEQTASTDEVERAMREAFDGVVSFGLDRRDIAPRELDLARDLLKRHRATMVKALAREHAPTQGALRTRNADLFQDLQRLVEHTDELEIWNDKCLTFFEKRWKRAYRVGGRGEMLFFGMADIAEFLGGTRGAESADFRAMVSDFAKSVLLSQHRHTTRRDIGAKRQLARLSPLGPFRQPAARLYTHSGVNPKGVGGRGELVADMLHSDADALTRTNEWLRTFDINYQLKLRTLRARRSDVFEVRLQDTRRSGRIDVAFTDVGFGISQMLPIVVEAVGTKNRVISIEQPEVHIHPRLQAEIAGLLVDCVRNNGHQFLVETHSEHLILRLRRLVREGKVNPEEIAVIHVGQGRDGSTVQRIGIKADGTFEHEWPGGFFPERMRELL
jgi:hypothetical protein